MAIAFAVRREHTEGQIAKSIESQTAKLPSDTFLWAAADGHRRIRNAPDHGKAERQRVRGPVGADAAHSGLYNKLVKQHGSDFTDTGA